MPGASHLLQNLAQFRLEQDDQGDGTDLKDILHQEADAPQLEDVCRQIDSHQCQQALDKLDRPGFPEQLDELEHHIRNNADINEIGDAEQGNLPNQHICKF